MNKLSSKELDLYSNQILEDYDAKNPSQIFRNKVKVSNEDALLIQNKVTELRVSRGEEIIGYKIGCISKDTQKKMDLLHLHQVLHLDFMMREMEKIWDM